MKFVERTQNHDKHQNNNAQSYDVNEKKLQLNSRQVYKSEQ